MADELPTIWEAKAHTLAKHQILKTYLKAWMPIMSRQSKRLGISDTRLLFVDGFAGPGTYAGGEDGSPVLALKSVLNHTHDFHVPVHFIFIEENKERFNSLRSILQEYKKQVEQSQKIEALQVKHGDCETMITRLLDDLDGSRAQVGPALFFLDQSGYSDVSMNLIQRIMSNELCEVFSYFNWDHLNRFLSDESKWKVITRAFGGEDWKHAMDLEQRDRASYVLRTYRRCLEERGGARHVWYFAMCDSSEKLLYWLFFCTNSLRGLEEMKRAMWKVDPTGGFRFSDNNNPRQLNLFTNYSKESLADELSRHFSNRTVEVADVKEFVLSRTAAYLYKGALKLLLSRSDLQVINPPPNRRRGTFPDESMKLTFIQKLL